MNLESLRAHVQLTRTLAPRLYTTTGGHDLATHPALIHPPAWMCHPCQNVWGEWGGAQFTTTQLDGGGEGKRRRVIAQQREDLAAACHQLAHARDREPQPVPPAEGVGEAPASLLGARAKALLDELEALLPQDGRTREQRLAAAVEAEKQARRYYERTRQPWQPAPTSADEEDVA